MYELPCPIGRARGNQVLLIMHLVTYPFQTLKPRASEYLSDKMGAIWQKSKSRPEPAPDPPGCAVTVTESAQPTLVPQAPTMRHTATRPTRPHEEDPCTPRTRTSSVCWRRRRRCPSMAGQAALNCSIGVRLPVFQPRRHGRRRLLAQPPAGLY